MKQIVKSLMSVKTFNLLVIALFTEFMTYFYAEAVSPDQSAKSNYVSMVLCIGFLIIFAFSLGELLSRAWSYTKAIFKSKPVSAS